MSKLTRKSAKLFAENAPAAAGGIAQFGSKAAGSPNFSTDPDVIQSLSQYSNGWSAACLGTKSPTLEDRNALDYLLSYQQAYIMQHGVPEWLDTETYYENSYVVDSNGELRVSVIDNNIGHDPTEDNGGAYWGFAGARGSGKQIGEVYFSQSSDGNDNKGALPLFTGQVISSADTVYPQFYAWVLSHTALCKTEAEWQTAISTYGECPFYVINTTNKTIRLPKLGNYIKMANTTEGITQSEAGLPNGSIELSNENGSVDGSIASGSVNKEGTYTKLSDFNSIFKDGVTTVTPAHTTVFPWVFAFNAAIPASTAQAAQFQAALSGKVDVADLAEIQCVVETWHDSTSWYRIYSDGWCEQGGTVSVSSSGVSTVNLLKEYASTSYQVFKNYNSSATSNMQDNEGSCFNKTVSSFDVSNSTGDTSSFDWFAMGYLE